MHRDSLPLAGWRLVHPSASTTAIAADWNEILDRWKRKEMKREVYQIVLRGGGVQTHLHALIASTIGTK